MPRKYEQFVCFFISFRLFACVCVSTASVLPATFIISASYAECDHLLVVVLFIISIGMHAFLTSGLSINPMDLSPNYAGTLMSLANGAGSLTGILAPYSVGVLTPHVSNQVQMFAAVFVWIEWALILIPFCPTGLSVRMENGLLADLCHTHYENCDLYDVGLGWCAAMEC